MTKRHDTTVYLSWWSYFWEPSSCPTMLLSVGLETNLPHRGETALKHFHNRDVEAKRCGYTRKLKEMRVLWGVTLQPFQVTVMKTLSQVSAPRPWHEAPQSPQSWDEPVCFVSINTGKEIIKVPRMEREQGYMTSISFFFFLHTNEDWQSLRSISFPLWWSWFFFSRSPGLFLIYLKRKLGFLLNIGATFSVLTVTRYPMEVGVWEKGRLDGPASHWSRQKGFKTPTSGGSSVPQSTSRKKSIRKTKSGCNSPVG